MGTNILLKEHYQKAGFDFITDINGIEVPSKSKNIEKEYKAVRKQIAIHDLSYVKLYKITGDESIEFLDYIVCGDVESLREEEMLHSFIANTNNKIVTDIYVANDNGDFLLFADGGSYEEVDALLDKFKNNFEVEIESINSSYAHFSVDGPYSWLPMKNLFSSEVMGIGYLEFFKLEDEYDTHIFRAGKTGERGFWILTKKQYGLELFNKILESIKDKQVELYGIDTLRLCKLENNFLDHFEVQYSNNPYELGLFWQIYKDKEFYAQQSIQKACEDGINRWVVGFTSNNDAEEINIGAPVIFNNKEIGVVINKNFSHGLGKVVGKALINKEFAYANINYKVDNVIITTCAMPFVLNDSLIVKAD